MEESETTRDELDAGSIASRLVSGSGYSSLSAKLTAHDLLCCTPLVWNAFLEWWRTGDLGQLQTEGYTVERLVHEIGFKPPAAYLMIDRLLMDPKAAKAVLARGFDSISPRKRPR